MKKNGYMFFEEVLEDGKSRERRKVGVVDLGASRPPDRLQRCRREDVPELVPSPRRTSSRDTVRDLLVLAFHLLLHHDQHCWALAQWKKRWSMVSEAPQCLQKWGIPVQPVR